MNSLRDRLVVISNYIRYVLLTEPILYFLLDLFLVVGVTNLIVDSCHLVIPPYGKLLIILSLLFIPRAFSWLLPNLWFGDALKMSLAFWYLTVISNFVFRWTNDLNNLMYVLLFNITISFALWYYYASNGLDEDEIVENVEDDENLSN